MKDRKAFFEKVKVKLHKTNRSDKTLSMLSELEPGKEYAGVVKYSNDPVEKVNAPN
jgi:hypothetical protein